MCPSKPAEIDVLWIAERKPDLFSSLIMWFLKRPYSHNAIIYLKTGMIWHAHAPGVCEEPLGVVLKGCRIAASRRLSLNVTEEYFEGFLEGERGKAYDNQANIGLVFPWLYGFIKKIPGLRRLIQNPDAARNCSEFVCNIVDRFHTPLPGRKNTWTPAFSEKMLNPKRYV